MARASATTEKSERAFRTISEAAEVIGVPQHVLRFWETRFPQLQPLKRGGNRRYYRPADMALLETIRAMLHDRGLTIRGAKLALVEEMETSRSAARIDPPTEPQLAANSPVGNSSVENQPVETAGATGQVRSLHHTPAVDLAALRSIRDRLRFALAA